MFRKNLGATIFRNVNFQFGIYNGKKVHTVLNFSFK